MNKIKVTAMFEGDGFFTHVSINKEHIHHHNKVVEIEISDDDIERIIAANKEFDKCQQFMINKIQEKNDVIFDAIKNGI